MPKINKVKKARALKAKKMHEIMRSRKNKTDEIDIVLAVTKKKIKCTEAEEFKTGEDIHLESNPVELKQTELQQLLPSLQILNQDSTPDSTTQQQIEPGIDTILEIESESTPPQIPLVEGRRIVDIRYFYDQLKEISNHGPLNCGLICIDIVGEKQIGLQSKFTLRCKMCNQKFYIKNEPPNDLDINRRAVAGTVSIGCGHSQLEEFSAALDLPMISQKTYQECHKNLSSHWEKIALDTMKEGAETERNLAITEGRVDKNGTPVIDVILDGCWSKRTYKKNYAALSGAAAIIGKRTGQILFLGVKNKYCCICAQAEKKGHDPKEHVCYKNYYGSSTGMESAILVEGFKTSIEMHNLIYGRMVSDGDSSTYSKLLQSRPYPHVTIQKIECRNHILRNLCNKIEHLKMDTKYPLRFRKCITQIKIMTIRKTIRMVIKKYNSDSDFERNGNVELLYNDILLSHLHAFADHSRCKTYFCSKEPSSEGIDRDLFTSSLWSRICLLISNVASHSSSLIHDVDSNAVERYNSIVAKFVGGKRVNFSLKGSYQTRCNAAVVSFNTHKVLSSAYKSIVGSSPKGKIRLLEQRRLKKMKMMTKYSRKKNRILFSKGQDSDYGEKCIKPDMPPDMYEREKVTFLKYLHKSKEERDRIQRETILQSGSSEWMEIRRNILTASNFGKVIKRRGDVSCSNLVKNLLYKDCLNHVKAIKHGRDYEKIALEQLAKQENVEIKACGLFIDDEIPYLGATPDGIINEDTIVEVKCPITAFKYGFEEAVSKRKIKFFKKNKSGQLEINKYHDWHYQIQGQLHITKASKCLFGLWYGENNSLIIEIIERDDKFWEDVMKKKLSSFYLDCVLPELVDPRNTRSMPIRDPEYIQYAIGEKKRKQQFKKYISQETAMSNDENILITEGMANSDIENQTENIDIEMKNNNETEIEFRQILGERQIQFSEF